MRRFILLAAAMLLGACSGGDTNVISLRGSNADTSSPEASAASIGTFSDELVRSPAWAMVRRGGAPDLKSLLDASRGQITGRLVGVSLAKPVTISASELVGENIEIQPGTEDGKVLEGAPVVPTVSLQSVILEVAVESTSGGLEQDLETVGIPITVWAHADAGEAQQQVLDDLVRRLDALAPMGVQVLVMAADLEADGDQKLVVTPGHQIFGSLASVVFETPDAGLVSLDPLIGDSAETYFRKSSLEELQEALAWLLVQCRMGPAGRPKC